MPCPGGNCSYCIYVKVAKLFKSGGSQAVRLPKEFRFKGSEVYVERDGVRLILIPKEKRPWPRRFFQAVRIADPAFRRPVQPEMPGTRRMDVPSGY
jgi:antitoxin VapB